VFLFAIAARRGEEFGGQRGASVASLHPTEHTGDFPGPVVPGDGGHANPRPITFDVFADHEMGVSPGGDLGHVYRSRF
jgi:hypothetical protein